MVPRPERFFASAGKGLPRALSCASAGDSSHPSQVRERTSSATSTLKPLTGNINLVVIKNLSSDQTRDRKLIGDTGPSTGKYVRGANGKGGFVIAESCDNAQRQPNRLRRRRSKWSKPKIARVSNCVLKDIERVIAGVCGGPCHTDHAGLFYDVALPFLVANHIAYGRSEETMDSLKWAHTHLPKLAAENPREWFNEAEQAILAGFDEHDGAPSIPDLDSVSRKLGVTLEKRALWGLKLLCAVERPPIVRNAEAKAKNAAYNKAKRAANGATPREQSIAARKPWLAYGIKSRRTWERKVERGELPPDPGMRPVQWHQTDDGRTFRVVPED